MSKNVKIGENTFNGVSTIKVADLDTSGVYDSFIDTSDATATQSDIVSGKIAYANGVKLTGNYIDKTEQTKTEALSMASGDQVVIPDSNCVLTKVTITKPNTLISDNIKSNVDIGGVIGNANPIIPAQTGDIWTFATSTGYRPKGTLYTYNSTSIYGWTVTSNISNGVSIIGIKLYDIFQRSIINVTSTTTLDYPLFTVSLYNEYGSSVTNPKNLAYGLENGYLVQGLVDKNGVFEKISANYFYSRSSSSIGTYAACLLITDNQIPSLATITYTTSVGTSTFKEFQFDTRQYSPTFTAQTHAMVLNSGINTNKDIKFIDAPNTAYYTLVLN